MLYIAKKNIIVFYFYKSLCLRKNSEPKKMLMKLNNKPFKFIKMQAGLWGGGLAGRLVQGTGTPTMCIMTQEQLNCVNNITI